MGLSIRHNTMNVDSVLSFQKIKGNFVMGSKSVLFIRFLGADADFLKNILEMDETLAQELKYKRINRLPIIEESDIDFYNKAYEAWSTGGRKEVFIKSTKNNKALANVSGEALDTVCRLYEAEKKFVSPSMEKNFVIKLLKWIDCALGEDCDWSERACIKLVGVNVDKLQEYLFYYLMTLLGCDVALLEVAGDLNASNKILELSSVCNLGEFKKMDLPEASMPEAARNTGTKNNENDDSREDKVLPKEQNNLPRLVIPARERRKSPQKVESKVPDKLPPKAPERVYNEAVAMSSAREKTYEELAARAKSVVMISVYDNTKKIVATGSGIMIGRQGYILTNNHVIKGGFFFGVRIEDDNELYNTSDVIKYNHDLDLAVIRIDRYLEPIPVCRDSVGLCRGQKVVAIGSPLGLFNSVSDGIISGFRRIDKADMIQFTAPISHGSSGGAVLNMKGEVVGISTAGIEEGQNINLAVHYEHINPFIRGFV